MNNPPIQDSRLLAWIQRLADEEHRLLERSDLNVHERQRLAALQGELDQFWDLLRQRRALREYGREPSAAKVRSPEVLKKYVG